MFEEDDIAELKYELGGERERRSIAEALYLPMKERAEKAEAEVTFIDSENSRLKAEVDLLNLIQSGAIDRAERAEAALDELRQKHETLLANTETMRNTSQKYLAELEEIHTDNDCNKYLLHEAEIGAEECMSQHKFEIEKLQDEIARLQAEAAAMRETCLKHCNEWCETGPNDVCGTTYCPLYAIRLSDAGKAMLARLSKLEALFSKAQVIELKGGGGFIGILASDALAALDGKEG